MSSRTLTGWMLILGPIVMWAGFMSIFPALGNVDWSDASEMLPVAGENAGLMKVGFSVAVLGMLVVAAGFSGLNHSMSDGSGAHYMRAGVLLYLMGATVVIGESALNIGMAEAASDGNQAVGGALYGAAHAIGSAGEATRFLGMAVIGFAIYTQKNLHRVLGCLMFLIGLVGVGLSVCVYQSDFMMIAYVGMTILIIATGILVVRAKE